MRKNGSVTTINAGTSNDTKKFSGNIIRGFFLALILIAILLSALAIHLSSQIITTKESTTLSSSIGTADNNNALVENKNVADARSLRIGDKNRVPIEHANAIEKEPLPYPNGPKTDAKYAKDRVYCMIPFIWNKEIYDIIMKTWGKRCNVIHFITDSVVSVEGKLQGDMIKGVEKGYKHHSEFPLGTFPENVKFVNMTRPWTGCKDKKSGLPKVCRHIWEKMWQSWIYVEDNHIDEAEWFCKIDYDTFFFPENLQYYVRDYKGWDPYNEHHYFGLTLNHRAGRPDMIAGAAACWSHKTLKAIAEVYRKMPKGYQGFDRNRCEDRPEASEEVSTSKCLSTINVFADPMLDDQNRQYVMVDPYHNHLTWNRTEQGEWWYWKGKPANIGQLEECCAVHPMATHKYKQKWQIAMLDQQFYGLADNKELTKLNERTRRYADKVRKAMGIDP